MGLNVVQTNQEDKTMSYSKPEVVALGEAISAIECSVSKNGSSIDATSSLATTTAYEADE